jgi:S-formylglutathione hydrolase FrmB
MRSLNWFRPDPFIAMEVRDWKPGESVRWKDSDDAFPKDLARWPKGKLFAQAILDRDVYFPEPASGPGNIHSEVQSLELTEVATMQLQLTVSKVIPEHAWEDTPRVKFLRRASPKLTEFHQRPFLDYAAVVLPESYHSEPLRRYGVYYEISGFGGSLDSMASRFRRQGIAVGGKAFECIVVLLTGQCKWGHHVYANSATNGPRGDVLIEELIPYIDQNFRTIADPKARFVGGHSSGGWSSLWLQVRYPHAFGGVWSSSPDPVDFRDWQGTNLYAQPTQSVFVDPAGNKRPLARRGRTPAIWYQDFNAMDDCLGRGGQLRSFEAVFSPLDANSQPRQCWDRSTGKVIPEVVEYWRSYDISDYLKQNWDRLREPLSGKLNVVMGQYDTFYLEGATVLLADRLKELGSDARIEIIPEASHSLPSDVMERRFEQMSARLQSLFPEHYGR